MNRRPFFLAALVCGILMFGFATARAEYQSKGKRDPFIPLLNTDGQRIKPPGLDEEVGAGVGGVTLQGIVFDPRAESFAVLNGQVIREYEDVNGIKVLKIESDMVTILVDGQTHELRVSKPKEENETKQ